MIETLFSQYLPQPMQFQSTPLGMFGGRLGGQMSPTDPLTLYLLRKHMEAQRMYGNPDPQFWRQAPLQELPVDPSMDYYL